MENNKFPDDLHFGFASSSYQIEGAWKEHGKGENIWDRFTHSQPDKIQDKSNGDVACDFYDKYKGDIKLMKEAGAQIYRFSLSWSRILPTGFSHDVNQNGIRFYRGVIDELHRHNIEPMVTLYHWDLPQPLQDLGGWANPILVDYFCDFAEVAFKHFGDKVKKWITINEPAFIAESHANGAFAPGVSLPGIADYLVGHNLLKAHAKAFQLYNNQFRSHQKGEVGISIDVNWREPISDYQRDLEAANETMQFDVGRFAHPIFGEKGDYPDVVKKKVAEESKRQGYPRSRLPEFDQDWIKLIKGSADFFGFNHYTTSYVSHKDSKNPPKDLVIETRDRDNKVTLSASADWEKMNEWLYVVPWGLRKALKWVKDNYSNPKIYITENGTLDTGCLEDNRRILYFHSYLSELMRAIKDDGCQVNVYTAWSFTDNFEWNKGYTEKFGFYHINFEDPERKRTPRKSVKFIKNVYKDRHLPELKEYNL